MSKLQLAIDMIPQEEIIRMIPSLIPYVDIFELGTPYCLRYGVAGAKKLHELFPEITLLADIKIFDGGRPEAKMYCEEGAKYITVMSRTNDSTIEDCAHACKDEGAQCMVDLMCEDDLPASVKRLEALGADILAVHVAYDQYTKYNLTPLKSLEELSSLVKTAKTAVAGGIKLENIDDYMKFKPDIVIVGGSILNAKDPIDAARKFSEKIRVQ